MKVAILTFHNSPNNAGAVLQAWALQRTVEKLGHVPVIIDYYRRRCDMVRWWNLASLRGVYYTLKRFPWEAMRIRKCNAFRRQNLNLDGTQYGGRVRYRNAEAFIVGSDQVFNPLNNECNPDFLLDFVPAGKKRIAYGASFGTNDFPEEYIRILKKSLPKFDALSVREHMGVESIRRIVDIDASVVLDPTLLLMAAEYRPLMMGAQIRVPTRPFVFLYIVGKHPDAYKIALAKAKEVGAQSIVVMTNGYAEWHVPHCGIFRRAYIYSPADFLAHIETAAFVVTNSFHGTAFSLIFNRSFVSLKNGTLGDSRIATLLDSAHRFGLDASREKSIAFLREALS